MLSLVDELLSDDESLSSSESSDELLVEPADALPSLAHFLADGWQGATGTMQWNPVSQTRWNGKG